MNALTVAAGLLLGLVPVLLVRGLAHRNFRRLFPRHATLMAGALLAWWTLVLCGSLWSPSTVLVLALVALAGSAWGALWARTSAGIGRALPPGDRSLGRSIRDLADRATYQRRFSALGPVVKAVQFSGTVVCIEGLERGQRLLREHRDSLGPSPLAFTQQVMGGFLRYMDDETHDVYGPLFRRAMSGSVTETATSKINEVAPPLLGETAAGTRDLGDALSQMSYESLLLALFGLDASSPQGSAFTEHYRAFARTAIAHPRRRSTTHALDALRRIARKQPVRDTASAIRELGNLNPSMPDDTCIDNLIFMLRIGATNVTGLLRWMLHFLASDPERRQHLSELVGGDHPEAADELQAFVFESLRSAQSEYVYRRLTNDVTFDGYRLKKGWRVRLCVWESHQDPSVFADPTHFTDRFAGQRFTTTQFCPFGFGRHACNGADISVAIAVTVLRRVVSNPSWTLVPADRLTRGFRHWSHWEPGSGLRLTSSTR